MEVCGEALRTCGSVCSERGDDGPAMLELRAQASATLVDTGTASYRGVTARHRKRRRNRQQEKRSNAERRDNSATHRRRSGAYWREGRHTEYCDRATAASGRLDRKDGCLSGRFAPALRSSSVRAAGGWEPQRRTHGRRKSARFQGLTRAPGRIATRELDPLSQIVGTQGQGIRVELDPFLRAEGKDEKDAVRRRTNAHRTGR